MALSIGELAGYLTLDDSQFEKGLDGAKGKFSSAGGWLKSNGKTIGLAAGAALGAAVAAGVAANINIGKANDKLAAQLGLSAKESGRVGKVAGDLYRNAYGDSIEGVNDAIRHVMQNVDGMSKASSKDLEGITASVLDVTTAFDQDLGMTTAAIGQMMRTGMAKDATEALDIITLGLQSPANKADDLMETMNEYGTQFRKLGIGGKDAMGLLSQGLQAGARDADVVADALKEFSIRTMEDLEQTNAQGQVNMTDLGAAFVNVLPKGKDMYDVQAMLAKGGKPAREAFDMMTEGLAKIKDPADRTKTAVALFGTQAEDMGDALYALDLDTAADGLGKVDGAAGKMGETLNDNFATRMEGWKRQASGFVQDGLMAIVKGFETGEATGDGFTGAMQSLGAFIKNEAIPALQDGAEKVQAFGRWIGENEKPIKIIGGVLASVLIPLFIVAGIQATISAAKQVAAWVATQAGAIKTGILMTTTAALMVAKWVWMGVQAMAQALRIAAAWLIAMGPIGLVIAAVVGLVVVIVKNWDKIKEVISAGWDRVKQMTTQAWAAVKETIGGVWEAVKDNTLRAALWIADKALGMAEKLLWPFAQLPGKLGAPFKAALGKVKGFRDDVNAEMDRLKDKKITVYIGTKADFATPSEKRAAAGASGGSGGVGGSGFGITPHVEAPRDQLHNAVGGVESEAKSIGAKRAKELEAALEAAAERVGPGGKAGPAGRVLPKGSYRIGMPYLGYPGHYGADYPAGTGTPVYAMASGKVSRAMTMTGSYGKHVYIEHPGGIQTRYAHLNGINAYMGQAIKAGQQLGTVGSTGNSSGPHLHFEYRRGGLAVNPAGLGLFDSGGLARNAGLMVKGPMPERVLNERQTEAFEDALDRNFGGGDELLAAIERQTAALKAAIDSQPRKAQQLARMGG